MTNLNRWYDMVNDGDLYPTYTRDSWEVPEDGTVIWCTGWKQAKTIKPYGDGCHVVIDGETFHCMQLMGFLEKWEAAGHTWGIEGVEVEREQQINGWWTPVKTA